MRQRKFACKHGFIYLFILEANSLHEKYHLKLFSITFVNWTVWWSSIVSKDILKFGAIPFLIFIYMCTQISSLSGKVPFDTHAFPRLDPNLFGDLLWTSGDRTVLRLRNEEV